LSKHFPIRNLTAHSNQQQLVHGPAAEVNSRKHQRTGMGLMINADNQLQKRQYIFGSSRLTWTQLLNALSPEWQKNEAINH